MCGAGGALLPVLLRLNEHPIVDNLIQYPSNCRLHPDLSPHPGFSMDFRNNDVFIDASSIGEDVFGT